MRVCPSSSDGKHYYIEKEFWATCIFCGKQITSGGVTNQWVKVEKPK